jgi:hypothetical protein
VFGVLTLVAQPSPTTGLPVTGGSGTSVLLVGVISGVVALFGTLLAFVRGKRTDKYGIYSQAFRDLTADIERVRKEATEDRQRADEKHEELRKANEALRDRIAELEARIEEQERELSRLRLTASQVRRHLEVIAELESQIGRYRLEVRRLRGLAGLPDLPDSPMIPHDDDDIVDAELLPADSETGPPDDLDQPTD